LSGESQLPSFFFDFQNAGVDLPVDMFYEENAPRLNLPDFDFNVK
jgi:hypothetical protein